MRWLALGSLLFGCSPPSATLATESPAAVGHPPDTGHQSERAPTIRCKLEARVAGLDSVAVRLIDGVILAMRTEWATSLEASEPLEIDCTVTHNADDVLSTRFYLRGRAMAMGWVEWWTFRRSSGERLSIEQLVHSGSLEQLTARLEALLQRELQLARAGALTELDPRCADLDYRGTFERVHLKNFEVTASGMTFSYPHEFPQAYRACQPPGRFSLSFSELGPMLLPLGRSLLR